MYGYPYENKKTLEPLGDKFLEWYDGRRKINRVNAYSKSHGNANLLDIMDMIETLLIMHQSKFYIDPNYGWLLNFPNLFIKPSVGDLIVNETTGEEYEILGIEEISSYEKKWNDAPRAAQKQDSTFTGRLFLKEGISRPSKYDRLRFKDISKNYINFFEWGTRRAATHPYNSNADASEQQQGPFRATITWNVVRVEPASIGAHPFDPAKALKPRIREVIPDPNYTYLVPTEKQINASLAANRYPIGTGWGVGSGSTSSGNTSYRILSAGEQSPSLSTHSIEIYGQFFDNIVQFDCWSDNNQEASYLISYLEDFLDLYAQILKINGVNELLYWQRTIDQKIERWRNDIDNRTLQYYFRTENLKVHRKANLNQYDIRIVVSHDPSSILLYSEPTGIGSTTGQYGYGATGLNYTFGSGVFFTGSGTYNWGRLVIME